MHLHSHKELYSMVKNSVSRAKHKFYRPINSVYREKCFSLDRKHCLSPINTVCFSTDKQCLSRKAMFIGDKQCFSR